MSKKILDFVAALCFCFDVDWDKDFPDDEYCLEKTGKTSSSKIVEISAGTEIPRAS